MKKLVIINKSKTKNRWIIDPIDGTMNFLNGIPHLQYLLAMKKIMKLSVVLFLIQLKMKCFVLKKVMVLILIIQE